jgi:hypothetical protein
MNFSTVRKTSEEREQQLLQVYKAFSHLAPQPASLTKVSSWLLGADFAPVTGSHLVQARYRTSVRTPG